MQAGSRKDTADIAKQAYIEGLKKYRDGNLQDACGFFSQAISAGIDDFDILYYRGMCNIDNKNYQEALLDFEVLVRYDMQNPEYLFRLGFIHYKLGMNSEALQDLSRIPCDFDDYSLRWYYLAVLFHKAGNFESALAAIEKALLKFPTMSKVWFNAGIILSSNDMDDRASLAFVAAAKLDPRLENAPRNILE